jgi:hypothetical protein
MQYIQLQAQNASSVPTSNVGNFNLFLDTENKTIKVKDDDGNYYYSIYTTGATYSGDSIIFTYNNNTTYTVNGIVSSPITVVNGTSLLSTGLGTNNTFSPSNSIFFGDSAGEGADDASDSNFFGPSAGRYATSAYNSNFMGPQAGAGATNADNSNFFGNQAGYEATDARNSNFIGQSAGYGAKNAYNSNFFGSSAGYGAINSTYSNFFGENAGKGVTGNNVNAFGESACANSTASNVNAFGAQVNVGGSLDGMTVFSNSSLPTYLDRATAIVAITEALGAVVGNTYLYYNETTYTIEAVRL